MEEKSLMIFHLGPVQDFIASARRCRDLWFGSWLLSELSKAAARSVAEQHGNDISCLVFPAPRNMDELYSRDFTVANKVVAIVALPPAELGASVQQAVRMRLREICSDAYSKISIDFDRHTAELQVEDMFEFFWAAYPVGENYNQARAKAEALMAARKVTRDFKAVAWGSSAPKSSLDGQRESVVPETAYPTRGMPAAERVARLQKLRANFDLQGEGERLCGVGLLKRLGEPAGGVNRFYSTAHFAALPLLHRLADRAAANAYIKTLIDLGVPARELGLPKKGPPVFSSEHAHLLFEGRLNELFDDEEKLNLAKSALQHCLRHAFGNYKPLPYYALLHADGDYLGKVIDQQKTIEQHQSLSRRLCNFAGKVAGIVQAHQGALVYSGGDDVLAFLPVHTVIACARSLAQTFQEEFGPFHIDAGGLSITPTLSVGIAISHYIDPLSDTLDLVRAAEKRAKSIPGKNALAVAVNKRSGSTQEIAGKWGEFDRRLEWFIELHRTEAIPDGAAFELRGLAAQLRCSDDAARQEAMRILRRKESQRGQQPIAEKELQSFKTLIEQQQVSVNALAEELVMARLFAQARTLAACDLSSKVVGS